jgi:tetratricopeptide (TPR) repeat protein
LLSELRFDEALEQIEKAQELDPLSPIINDNFGGYYFAMRDYQKALEFYRRATELGMVSAHFFMALTYGRLKMFDDMRRESAIATKDVIGTFPLGETGDEAFFAWMEGDSERLRNLLPKVEEHLQDTGWNYCVLAMPYFFLDDKDKGFELLEKSYSEKEILLATIKSNDAFDNARADSRYSTLLKKLGLE